MLVDAREEKSLGSSSNRQQVPEMPDREEMQQKHQQLDTLLLATVWMILYLSKRQEHRQQQHRALQTLRNNIHENRQFSF